MKELDDELRNVLRREEPPEGFAERVLRRIDEPDAGPADRLRPSYGGQEAGHYALTKPILRWAAAAALVAAVAGGLQYRELQRDREERARGEAAKQQVVQALQIASSKLQLVQAKVKGVGQ